ncbi:MAG: barstar family protein [Burkholderiales bacterium]|jgi:RNAse (barnase) inhibitor barstar|nr:barstar family protein [Burkholderiales bacterium]
MKPINLDDAKRADIRHINTANAVEKFHEACRQSSLRYYPVNCENILNKKQLLNLFADALEFPDYFGYNWDALYDVLCDDDWIDEHGVVLHLKHTALLQSRTVYDWQMLHETLEEVIDYWRSLDTPFWVFIDHTR